MAKPCGAVSPIVVYSLWVNVSKLSPSNAVGDVTHPSTFVLANAAAAVSEAWPIL